MCGRRLAPGTVEGRERLCCEDASCGYVFWDNPVPVVAALVEEGGKVVLVRNRAWPEKMFGLVTGFLEKGETPGEAVLREVEEELGLKGEQAGLIGCYGFLPMNQVIIAYHVKVEGEPVLGGELAEFRRVDPENLRPWDFGTGHAVRDWLERRRA